VTSTQLPWQPVEQLLHDLCVRVSAAGHMVLHNTRHQMTMTTYDLHKVGQELVQQLTRHVMLRHGCVLQAEDDVREADDG
jgi:hypothetical protein